MAWTYRVKKLKVKQVGNLQGTPEQTLPWIKDQHLMFKKDMIRQIQIDRQSRLWVNFLQALNQNRLQKYKDNNKISKLKRK